MNLLNGYWRNVVKKLRMKRKKCNNCDNKIDYRNISGLCRFCKFCIDCGKNVSRNSKKGRCKSCLNKNLFGSNNPNWKDSGLTYTAIHRWIKKYYGKADRCENKKCNYENPHHYEWDNISEKYLKDRKDWQRLCVSCHVRRHRNKKRRTNEIISCCPRN